ncbi:MAG TPA: hypothetical protein VMR06_06670 [Dokdonella sp.]|uniref:hypothetical protein n=1 Tax=Dokdonella sp. TaxID=2291710 RepID=UPI002B631579|nr:hypothetical protein [Dokdonella sp.]HUD41668.1 hypothetical protein [Dokdonella sp.]
MRFPIPAFPAAAALALLALATAAPAATYSVGPGATCTHGTLQAALDAAANNPGPDVVRIVRSATWTGIQVSTQTDQDVEILGGWLACTSAAADGKTTLSGAGGQARSVIALRGNGRFMLRNLVVRDGDQAGDDDGGGIHFIGGGIVDIADSEIVDNAAEDGGGVYAQGTTAQAELIIGANVTIANNAARRHGGGVVAQNIEMTMIAPNSVLLLNTAGGRGGGLLVASGSFASYAYIGSRGVLDLGPVYGNRAAIGGGIAVLAGEDSGRDAEVQVFSTNPAEPLRILDNFASERGGAIDLQPDGESGNNASAIAQLRHVAIEGNAAPVGAAINLGYDPYGPFGADAIGGQVHFNHPHPTRPLHAAAAACPFGAPCGSIRYNRTLNTTGAVVHLSEDADFDGSRIAIEGNEAGWLIYLSGEDWTSLQLDNSLVAGNTVQHALIRDDQNEDAVWPLVGLHYLTVAGNGIGANGVLSINEDMAFTRSLVDQPGKAMIATDVGAVGGNHDIQHVIANTSTVPGGTTLAPPRFVDPAGGDYLPRAGSRAVDFAAPLASFPQDLHSHTRSLDLPVNPNESGASDAGALEREYLQPLVLNAGFDADLNHWEALSTSSWDGTQNASGPSGSGSVRGTAAADDARVAVRRQCIHLPGPARYALNGWGRATGAGPMAPPHRVWLDWELRYSTGTLDGCTDAPPAATGSLLLASGSTWARPALPAIIDVTPAVWGQTTSLTVYLVVQNGSPIAPGADGGTGPEAVLGGPDGWFDGVTLETDFDDTIFRDGFE